MAVTLSPSSQCRPLNPSGQRQMYRSALLAVQVPPLTQEASSQIPLLHSPEKPEKQHRCIISVTLGMGVNLATCAPGSCTNQTSSLTHTHNVSLTHTHNSFLATCKSKYEIKLGSRPQRGFTKWQK